MFSKKSLTEKDKISLFSKIRRSGPEGRKAMETIFRQYDHLKFLSIYKTRGKQHLLHAEDYLHEAFLIFRKNVIERKVDPATNVNRYITSIAKNLIQNEQRKYSREEISMSDIERLEIQDSPTNHYYKKEEVDLLVNQLFSHINPLCQKILKLWANGFAFREIAKKLNMESESAARKNKYKCYAKLQEYLPQYAELKSYYNEQ